MLSGLRVDSNVKLFGNLIHPIKPHMRFLFLGPMLSAFFLQSPPRNGHPCLQPMLPASKPFVDLHRHVSARTGHTKKRRTPGCTPLPLIRRGSLLEGKQRRLIVCTTPKQKNHTEPGRKKRQNLAGKIYFHECGNNHQTLEPYTMGVCVRCFGSQKSQEWSRLRSTTPCIHYFLRDSGFDLLMCTAINSFPFSYRTSPESTKEPRRFNSCWVMLSPSSDQ